MPSNITLIKIFIASPSDVLHERNLVHETIEELNKTTAKHLDLRLELIGWENNVYPAFGEDPQDVINKQINDNYDVFIGIMWGRFGTPTKRDLSGTKEEFERAYSRYITNPESVDLFFYFKNAPIEFDSIDIQQLKLVKEFQQDFGNRGGLYKTFKTQEEFCTLLRTNFSDWIQTYSQRKKGNPEIAAIEIDSDIEEEEKGLFELNDELKENGLNLGVIFDNVSDLTMDIGNKMGYYNNKIRAVNNSNSPLKEAQGRIIVDELAGHLINYSQKLTTETSMLNEKFKAVQSNCQQLITIYKTYEFDNTILFETKHSIEKLVSDISSANVNTIGFRNDMKKWLIVTTKFANAKKRVIKALDLLSSEFSTHATIFSKLAIEL